LGKPLDRTGDRSTPVVGESVCLASCETCRLATATDSRATSKRNRVASKFRGKVIMYSVQDKLRDLHFVTTVLAFQIAYRILMLLRRLNY
jgi:hypothetical protein